MGSAIDSSVRSAALMVSEPLETRVLPTVVVLLIIWIRSKQHPWCLIAPHKELHYPVHGEEEGCNNESPGFLWLYKWGGEVTMWGFSKARTINRMALLKQ